MQFAEFGYSTARVGVLKNMAYPLRCAPAPGIAVAVAVYDRKESALSIEELIALITPEDIDAALKA